MSETPENSLLGKIAAYTEILAKDPRSTIFVSLSEAYRKMGMLSEACNIAENGLASLPDYCPGHVVLARIRCQQGDLRASEVSFVRALEIDPQSLAALVGFSRICLLQERHAEARSLLLKARELSPADPVINKLLLSLPEEVERLPPASSDIKRAEVDAEASSVQSVEEPVETVTLAELYLKQGLADKALGIYRNLLARDPDNLELRRRIRDLESPAFPDEGMKIAPSSSESSVDIAAEPQSVSDDIQSSEELPVIDRLNRLLVSIQKRRGDV